MADRESNPPHPEALGAALRKARAAIDEALRLVEADERPLGLMSALRVSAPSAPRSMSVGETPMSLEDLDSSVLQDVVGSLPELFDTYHVVEHPTFRARHADLLDRPAINQLTGKALRRLAPALRIAYIGQRGRRRSALWQRQRLPGDT